MAERTGYAPGAPNWVDLTVPDLEAALTFYGGLFGWEFEDQGEEAGHYHQALKHGKRVAGIGPNQPGTPPMAFWTTYLTGTDVDAHASQIRSAGGKVTFGPMQVLDAGRMVAAQDPAGAMFGIWEPGEHTGAQLHDEHAALSWNELMTRDLEGAAGFYGSLFDYALEPLPEQPEGYRLLKLGDDYVGGIWSLTDESPARWVAYFKFDDVDAGFERVRELGGELTGDPLDSPYGRWAPVRDPQGASFHLISTNP
jgi:predicted enzyme related to lactoylglutathione lyase